MVLNSINARNTNIDNADDRMSMRIEGRWLFIQRAYSADASARKVSGKEYAHHTMLNRVKDLLKRAGLEACTYHDANKKSERNKSILEQVSKLPEIALHDRLAVLGVAMNKKKTGLSIAGSLSRPEER